jgi:hypothetical protein
VQERVGDDVCPRVVPCGASRLCLDSNPICLISELCDFEPVAQFLCALVSSFENMGVIIAPILKFMMIK